MADMLDCYHIPDAKGRDGGSDVTPVFRLPMKPAHADFVIGKNPKDWYDASSERATKVPAFDAKQQATSCIISLCHTTRGGYLNVYKGKRGEHKIKQSSYTTA
jgi:hypothetical protein